MYSEGKCNWLNHINNALENDKNRANGTTKMTPFEASNNLEEALRNNYTAKLAATLTYGRRSWCALHKLRTLQVGDFVPDKLTLYSNFIQQIEIENC